MSTHPPRSPKGRGAASNPANRFEILHVESEVEGPDRLPTHYLRDSSRSVIVRNESPDVPFAASVNPYRGCEQSGPRAPSEVSVVES